MMTYLFIGAGGFIGAISRFLVSKISFLKFNENLPLPTISVNVLGCFIIGIVATLYAKNQISSNLFHFIVVGFLGSFTTFSAFGLETVKLFNSGRFYSALINIFLSVVMGIFAAYIGFKVIKLD